MIWCWLYLSEHGAALPQRVNQLPAMTVSAPSLACSLCCVSNAHPQHVYLVKAHFLPSRSSSGAPDHSTLSRLQTSTALLFLPLFIASRFLSLHVHYECEVCFIRLYAFEACVECSLNIYLQTGKTHKYEVFKEFSKCSYFNELYL